MAEANGQIKMIANMLLTLATLIIWAIFLAKMFSLIDSMKYEDKILHGVGVAIIIAGSVYGVARLLMIIWILNYV